MTYQHRNEITPSRNIDILPRTFQRLVESVEKRTGYPMVILWGGPQVRENGVVGTWEYVFQTM
jgi:hypothetical protein